jgi:hypothetical protein
MNDEARMSNDERMTKTFWSRRFINRRVALEIPWSLEIGIYPRAIIVGL